MEIERTSENTRAALNWAISGKTGASSLTLVRTHFGVVGEIWTPVDHGDRERCIGALRAIPGLMDTLAILATVSPGWNQALPLILEEMGPS